MRFHAAEIALYDASVGDTQACYFRVRQVKFLKLTSIDPQVASNWGMQFTYQLIKSKNVSFEDMGLQQMEDYPKVQLDMVCR